MDISEIKEIAKRFTPEQIENCINQQIESGTNICLKDDSSERIINELSKARFIRELIEKGYSLTDALRELARRVRQIQSYSKE